MPKSHTVPGLRVRKLALEALEKIQDHGGYTDVVVQKILSSNQIDAVDSALFSELVRGVVRHRMTLDYYISTFVKSVDKLDPVIRLILHMGFYQLAFLERIPDHAVVHSSVALADLRKRKHLKGLVNAVLRNYIRQPVSLPDLDTAPDPANALAVRYSFPDWMVRQWIDQLGATETEQLLIASNSNPGLSLRISRDRAVFFESAQQMNLDVTPSTVPGYVTVKGLGYAQQYRLLNEIKLVVQDASAGLVSLIAQPQKNWKIADVCAAPGGKGIHCAELTEGKSDIISADLNLSRLYKIKENCQRLDITNIYLVQADSRHSPFLPVDLVLLDAPCSGLGVIRKKPDLKWNKSQEQISQLVDLQLSMLEEAATLVKKQGYLIYSTCTTTKQENENVVFAFLSKNSDFIALDLKNETPFKSFVTNQGFIRTWPHRDGLDGSFVAKLQRV